MCVCSRAESNAAEDEADLADLARKPNVVDEDDDVPE